MKRARIALVAALALTVGPAALAAQPAGAAQILQGRAAGGGSWMLSASHTRLGGVAGLCLDLSAKLADGSSPGSGGGCFAGDLRAAHGVAPIAIRSKSGATLTSSLVGGLVTSRASSVHVIFADGTRLRLLTHAGPRAWRHELNASVRWYGADALGHTRSAQKSVIALDRRGHVVGQSKAAHR